MKLNQKLILYNLFIIICLASFLSFYNYNSYQKNMIQKEIENSSARIQILSGRIQLAYDEMINIVLNCAERKSLFFSITDKNRNTSAGKQIAIYMTNVLKDYCAISGYGKYIAKLTLYHKDTFMLQAGYMNGSQNDAAIIMDADWFEDCVEKSDLDWSLYLVDSPFPEYPKEKLLSFIRPLRYSYNSNAKDAWIFLGISSRLFDFILSSSEIESTLYVVTNKGNLISSLYPISHNITPFIQSLLKRQEQKDSFFSTIGQTNYIISYKKLETSELLVFELTPVHSIQSDSHIIIHTIVFIFLSCLIIGSILSVFMSYQISKPIHKLIKRLKCITNGDFTSDSSIEGLNEIGTIGTQINQMSAHISDLMETRIQSETEKRELEIKMLQAQINPHFLYNTLDSIRWIATMQKNSGIVQIVTSLSSLLKNMAKGFNEKVTLKQELDFLNDYITIEKIRYIELFDVEIELESEQLYDAKIIKLTLQPLVENAIFSGIEPSGRPGLIQIHVCATETMLSITVQDNGIGIPENQINSILLDTTRVTKSNMSGIGLPNVDRRLKLVYGEQYGLTIESQIEEFTKITISLPLEWD